MNVHASALAQAHLPDEQTTAFAREAEYEKRMVARLNLSID